MSPSHNVAPRWGYGSGYLQGSQNAPHPSLRDAVLPLRPNASSRGLQTCDLQARKPIVPESGYGRPRRAGAAASLPPGTLLLYVEQRDATMLYDVERAGYRQLNALLDIDRRSGQAAVHCDLTPALTSPFLSEFAQKSTSALNIYAAVD